MYDIVSSFFFFSKDNKGLDKKGFDNLANKEQGEQQKKHEEDIQNEEGNQEKPKTLEEPASCEHQDQRERLGNEEKDGIIVSFFIVTS